MITLSRRTVLAAAPLLALAGCAGGEQSGDRSGVDVDWTRYPDGPAPDRTADGHPLTYTLGPGVATRPSVDRGLVGNLPDSRTASYVTLPAPAPVTEIGATFRFTGTDPQGSVCLAVWPAWPPPSGADIPDTTCHLVVTPTSFDHGVWRDRQLHHVASGPLRSVPTTARVVHTGTSARVEIAGTTVAEAPLGPFGAVPCWEFYRHGPGGAAVTFSRTWARW